ncbi:hypothetical protein D915_002836 [Fasciola hepatica]|uniref:Uncharacterized protein n=1 Tax=Fasciola hepatica TaxID=6192 RepID=A0A4E0RKI2_FASHE|nr:hypothetical protein D915_002836 [Fasciola hepatica]
MYSTQSTTAINRNSPKLPGFKHFQSRIPRSSTGGELAVATQFPKGRESSPSLPLKKNADALRAKHEIDIPSSNSTTAMTRRFTSITSRAAPVQSSTSIHSAIKTTTSSATSNGPSVCSSPSRLATWTPPSKSLNIRAPWTRPNGPQTTTRTPSSLAFSNETISKSTTTASDSGSVTAPHMSSVTIPSLANRPHIRTSPYDRLSRLNYSIPPGRSQSTASSIRTHPSYKSSTTARSQTATGVSEAGHSVEDTRNELTQINSPTVTLVTRSVAYCPAPETITLSPREPLESVTSMTALDSAARPQFRTELSIMSGCSIASDDLMLDTDAGWLDSGDEEPDDTSPLTNEDGPKFGNQRDKVIPSTTRSSSWSRGHVVPHLSRESSMTHTRLESVTEMSHDDLTRLPVSNKSADQTESSATSTGKPAKEIGEHTVVHLRPKPDLSDKSVYTTIPDQRRHTTAFGDSPIRPLFSGLRRLRSIPGRHRSVSTSSSTSSNVAFGQTADMDDLTAETHLGERTCVLLASEQRQMVQDLQGIKVTLLKLKRLLSEDQWHLPIFHEQLSLTEPTSRTRSRKPLPREWTTNPGDFGQSEESVNVTPVGRSRTCSDSGVAPAPYSSSLTSSDGPPATGDRYSDLSPTDESLALSADPTAMTKLLVNLAQLQKENQQLYICPESNVNPNNREQKLSLSYSISEDVHVPFGISS